MKSLLSIVLICGIIAGTSDFGWVCLSGKQLTLNGHGCESACPEDTDKAVRCDLSAPNHHGSECVECLDFRLAGLDEYIVPQDSQRDKLPAVPVTERVAQPRPIGSNPPLFANACAPRGPPPVAAFFTPLSVVVLRR